jgi:rRNA processing protein Krr1/Pno1
VFVEPDKDIPIFLDKSIEDYVPVPKSLIRKIIGKQAQTIREIREKSGCYKCDARDQTSDPVQVKVEGTEEACARARQMINDLIESASAKFVHADSEYVLVPKAKVGMVVGLKGAEIARIQSSTDTKIDIDFEPDPCKVYIKGQPDCVEKAKVMVLQIAMQIDDQNSEYLELPRDAAGVLIGVQGSRVRDLSDQTGCRIDVDKTGHSVRVRLCGTPEQVANAKQLIMFELEKSRQEHRNSMVKNTGPSFPIEPMVVPAHQPQDFPATLSESIARARAAANAVKNGFVTTQPPPPPFSHL